MTTSSIIAATPYLRKELVPAVAPEARNDDIPNFRRREELGTCLAFAIHRPCFTKIKLTLYTFLAGNRTIIYRHGQSTRVRVLPGMRSSIEGQMRVGVYVPEIRPESGGALTFVRDVLSAVAAGGCSHDFYVLYSGPVAPEGNAALPLVQVPDASSPMDATLDATAYRLGLDVVWFLTPQLQVVTLPFIVTVWDLEHRNQPYFPEVSVTGWTWEEREFYYRSTLPRAACVIVGTEEVKRQVERFYGVPAALIAVVPFVTPSFSAEELRDNPKLLSEIRTPFIFYPAQFWPHKNHVTLLHAIKKLNEHGQFLNLILTGADKGNLGHVQALARQLQIDEQVQLLGFVDRHTIATLYRRALALAYPSFFGPDNLPPLEAFALGCPVVAAALPGTAALFGGAAILLDPTDAAAWASAFGILLREPHRRTELAKRGLMQSRNSSPSAYLRAVAERLDALEPIRRCWSRNERYIHSGAQPTAAEQALYAVTDRAGALDVIRTLQLRLEACEADSAAGLEAIHRLQHQIEAAEADRTACQKMLEATEADRAACRKMIERLQSSRSWRWTRAARWLSDVLSQHRGVRTSRNRR